MNRIKKVFTVVSVVLMVMSAFFVTGFAAESECSEHNVYSAYVDGAWYEVCDSCGYKECFCESNVYDRVYEKNYAYNVCSNCGKKTIYCDHSEYDFVDWDYSSVYCGVTESCTCGHAVISGTKHELDEYNSEEYNNYFTCSLCDRQIRLYDLEDYYNFITDNGDGTYSGEWACFDSETGLIIGSGDVTIDEDGVLSFTGEGVLVFAGEGGTADKFNPILYTKECDYCTDYIYEDVFDEDGNYVESTVVGEEPGSHYIPLMSKVNKVAFGEKITEIRELAYLYDVFLGDEIEFPDSLEKIEGEFIAGNATINIPENCYVNGTIIAKEINLHNNNPYYAIDENGSLYSKDMTVLYRYNGTEKEVSIPEGVKELSEFAFAYNKYIEKVNIPSSVKTVSDSAFFACVNLKEVALSSGLEKIGEVAFMNCISLEEVIMPDTVTEIGRNAFDNCLSLSYVQLSENLKEIPEQVFSECMNLKTINIPLAVEKIGKWTFNSCLSLEEINIYSVNVDLSESDLGLVYAEVDTATKEKHFELMKEAYKYEIEGAVYPEEDIRENYGSFKQFRECKLKELIRKLEELQAEIVIYDPPIPSELLTIYCKEGSTAEAYAKEKGIKYVADACEHNYGEWVTDEENSIRYKVCDKCGKSFEEEITDGGIVVESPEDDGKNKFSIEYIDNPENTEYIYVRGIVDGNMVGLYDINLIDEKGNKVQPEGKVKIKLPLDSGVTYFTVLRINDDGSVTDMNAVREGDYAVFETDHFSYYVILGGENEEDTGNNIKCECICHTHPFLEFIFRLFKLLTKLFSGPLEFPCDC